MTKRERYIRNQEAIKSKALYKILQKHKGIFADLLEKEDKSFRLTLKYIGDDIIWPFLDDIKGDIPEYLLSVLPKIMQEWAKDPIARYKYLLPDDYALVFDVDTEPATIYLKELEDLMLSQRSWSILKTTRDELRTLIWKWIEEWQSYWQIAKQRREVDPFVFSKARAKTIAVNEIWRSYGWANHEPWRELTREGYVLEKSWQTSDDKDVRDSHRVNEKAWWIPFDDLFPWTDDEFAPSPTEINCRCTSIHQVTWIKAFWQIHRVPRDIEAKDIKKLFENLKNWV